MEPYMPISYLNDFIFCPRSIYFHQLYGRVSQRLYHTTAQTKGKAAHKTVDTQTYTTAKSVLQGMEVYSDRYKIGGKIDTYDASKSLLVERKKKIKVVYDGYIYQLFAQYHCLVEMGYEVQKMKLYSMDDNKSYPIKTPPEDTERQKEFDDIVHKMKNFDLNEAFVANENKCRYCIYNNLCDVAAC
ncbi:MAG TPA: type V CRISPR-associated protein Cas4 [Sulfurimonas sp.]|nr:type V CRISPR-associated protein Cas4 [Sulfurimonas sp.]